MSSTNKPLSTKKSVAKNSLAKKAKAADTQADHVGWTWTTTADLNVVGKVTMLDLKNTEINPVQINIELLLESLAAIRADIMDANSGRWIITETIVKVGDSTGVLRVVPTEQRVVEISQKNPMYGVEFRIRFDFFPHLDGTRPLIASNIQKIVLFNKAAFEIDGKDVPGVSAYVIKKTLDELVDLFKVNETKERVTRTNKALSSMLQHINKTIS
jgi:hypothetical protein